MNVTNRPLFDISFSNQSVVFWCSQSHSYEKTTKQEQDGYNCYDKNKHKKQTQQHWKQQFIVEHQMLQAFSQLYTCG